MASCFVFDWIEGSIVKAGQWGVLVKTRHLVRLGLKLTTLAGLENQSSFWGILSLFWQLSAFKAFFKQFVFCQMIEMHVFAMLQIYSSCEEAYRLTATGEIHVPPDCTNDFCNGACLKETNLILNCVEGVLSDFEFYNKATINDVRHTIKEGCSYGPNRGVFSFIFHCIKKIPRK